MTYEPEDSIRILLLNHLTLMRAGVRMILEHQPGLELVGEAGDLEEGLQLVSCKRPDIILYELSQVGDLGLDGISRLIHVNGRTRLILVTRSTDPKIYLQAVQYGALGVVNENQPPEILLKAIRKVHAGEAWIDHALVAALVTNMAKDHPTASKVEHGEQLALLSPREREIIQMIAQGVKTKQIAAQLFVSETTVRHYLTAIYEKLGVSDRVELLIFAHRAGMTDLSR